MPSTLSPAPERISTSGRNTAAWASRAHLALMTADRPFGASVTPPSRAPARGRSVAPRYPRRGCCPPRPRRRPSASGQRSTGQGFVGRAGQCLHFLGGQLGRPLRQRGVGEFHHQPGSSVRRHHQRQRRHQVGRAFANATLHQQPQPGRVRDNLRRTSPDCGPANRAALTPLTRAAADRCPPRPPRACGATSPASARAPWETAQRRAGNPPA
jgi:hypothetical protein